MWIEKCGIYPLNPGEVNDRPSKAVRLQPAIDDNTSTPLSSREQEALHHRKFYKGDMYDVNDADYIAWMRV